MFKSKEAKIAYLFGENVQVKAIFAAQCDELARSAGFSLVAAGRFNGGV